MPRAKQRDRFIAHLLVAHRIAVIIPRLQQHREQIALFHARRAPLRHEARHNLIQLGNRPLEGAVLRRRHPQRRREQAVEAVIEDFQQNLAICSLIS